jgi:hypothetical protein
MTGGCGRLSSCTRRRRPTSCLVERSGKRWPPPGTRSAIRRTAIRARVPILTAIPPIVSSVCRCSRSGRVLRRLSRFSMH